MTSERRFDLLIELDRSERPALNVDKLHRYDALITAWWRHAPQLNNAAEPPGAVFICPEHANVLSLMERADRELTGALIGRPGDPPEQWQHPTRTRTIFVCERDIHNHDRRGYMLPSRPPSVGRGDFAPREVQLPGRANPNGAEG